MVLISKREEEQARGERERARPLFTNKLKNVKSCPTDTYYCLCSSFLFLFVDKENAKCTRVAHNFHPVIDVN